MMASFYAVKSDNALKRAEELQSVGQYEAALQTLRDVAISKRSRSIPITVMEPIMLKYVELCVELKKEKLVKEGLRQYRNIAQNTSVDSIEKIIDKLLELAEEKVAEARAKADKIAIKVDDLEASETPESVMLSTVSGDQGRDRTNRAVVTPWLKFLWGTYHTVLDIIRNNARLKSLYHSVTLKTLQFCLTYNRKTEFRRLCDILRNHFFNVTKYSHQSHAVNLNDPDTLQQFLDSRFAQLNAATELELWQEAFKSIEDIHTLLTTSKRPPKPIMMANYYEKLTKIFMVSDDYLFHSAAWNCYSSFERSINKNLSDEEQSRMASTVLLSALAVPIITTTKTRPGYVEANQYRISKLNRLSMLMGLPNHPTRTGLLKEALNKNILSRVRPEIRDLYNILEVQFHPLSICKKINPIMIKLSEDADLAKYLRPLQDVILTRLLQQLSQVYTTVKLDFVLNLASFPSPFSYGAAAVEKFIMNGCKRGELNIRIDHASKSLIFETDLFAPPKDIITEGIQLQSSPAGLMHTQLSRLGVSLHAVVQMIDPLVNESATQSKQEAAQRALKGAEEEHKIIIARKNEIERRKEMIETETTRKEKLVALEKAAAAAKKAAEEKKRVEEELIRRERERLKRIQDEIQRDQAKRLIEEINNTGGPQMKPEEIGQNGVEILNDIKVSRLQVEQKKLSERLKQVNKRMDFIERAYRKEEIPLLKKDYENQQKSDKAFFEASHKAALVNSKTQFEEDIKLKNRLSRIKNDYNAFKTRLEDIHREVTESRRREADQLIEKEKQERIALWFKKRDEISRFREAEQEKAARKEREERERAEKEQREKEKKEARIAQEKAEYAEKQKKLDEIARIQAQREAEIERKLAESASSKPSPAKKVYVPSGAPAAAAAAASESGANWRYRPVSSNIGSEGSRLINRFSPNNNDSNNDRYGSSDHYSFSERKGSNERREFRDHQESDRYGNRSSNRDNGGNWRAFEKEKDSKQRESDRESEGGGWNTVSKGSRGHRGSDRGSDRPRGVNRGAGAGSAKNERRW